MLSGVNNEHLTADGAVTKSAGAIGAYCGALLTSGSDAASATIRDGDASGTIIAIIKCASGESEIDTCCVGLSTGNLHVTFTGTSPTLDIRFK